MGYMDDLLSSFLPQDFGGNDPGLSGSAAPLPQPPQPPPGYGVVENQGGTLRMTQPGPYSLSQIQDNQAGLTPMPRPRPYVADGQGASAYQPQLPPTMQEETGQPQPNWGGDSFASTMGATQPTPLDVAPGAEGMTAAIPPRPPQPVAGAAGQGAGPSVPLPQPRPASAPQVPLPPPRPPQISLPPNATPTVGGPPMSLAPQPPQQNTPALPPWASQTRPPELQPRTGFMGMTPENARRLGAGLSAVAKNAHASPLAAFAGTAGASIEGGENEGDKQQVQNRANQGQHFNQLSTGFKDMMTARQQDNMEQYRAAQAKYLSARAEAIAKNGGTGSGAYQNTPQAQVLKIEQQSETQFKSRALILQQQWKLNGTGEDQQNQQLQALRTEMDQKKNALYQRLGLNPQQAENIKTMGMNPPTIPGPNGQPIKNPNFNPFDARTMTPDQFHSQVPIGAWFTYKDGKVYQRTEPPPGQQGTKQRDKTSALETANDDAIAMGGQESVSG